MSLLPTKAELTGPTVSRAQFESKLEQLRDYLDELLGDDGSKPDKSILRHRRNLLINGNLNAWQRGTSFVSPANGDYLADRWRWNHSGSGLVTVSRSTTVPDKSCLYSLKVDVDTADASLAAGDYYELEQRIEGHNIQVLKWGAAGARKAAVGFWVRSSKTGTFTVAFRNATPDRSYVAEIVINVANTWEFKTVILTAGPTDGTWAIDHTAGLLMSIVLAAGTDWDTTKDAWQSSNDRSTAAADNYLDNVANDFYFAQTQLEAGDVGTPFEFLPASEEVELRERYYQKTYEAATDPGALINIGAIAKRQSSASTALWVTNPLRVRMRTAPTITIYNPNSGASGSVRNDTAGSNNVVVSIVNEGETNAGRITLTSAPTAGDTMRYHYTADAEL